MKRWWLADERWPSIVGRWSIFELLVFYFFRKLFCFEGRPTYFFSQV